jgi:hypothetical protein
MKFLRCLFALMLVCALSGMAKADPIDFHMVVVDPPTGFDTTPINSLTPPTTIGFSDCVPGQIPGVADPYEGCASFENSTSSAITSLLLVFPDTSDLDSQTANCGLDPNTSVNDFASVTCSLTNGNYILNFTDGSIGVGGLFTVAEDGVDPSDFPDGTLTAASAPEPSSIWLMSTGALLLGAFFYSKRRNGFGSMGL